MTENIVLDKNILIEFSNGTSVTVNSDLSRKFGGLVDKVNTFLTGNVSAIAFHKAVNWNGKELTPAGIWNHFADMLTARAKSEIVTVTYSEVNSENDDLVVVLTASALTALGTLASGEYTLESKPKRKGAGRKAGEPKNLDTALDLLDW